MKHTVLPTRISKLVAKPFLQNAIIQVPRNSGSRPSCGMQPTLPGMLAYSTTSTCATRSTRRVKAYWPYLTWRTRNSIGTIIGWVISSTKTAEWDQQINVQKLSWARIRLLQLEPFSSRATLVNYKSGTSHTITFPFLHGTIPKSEDIINSIILLIIGNQ